MKRIIKVLENPTRSPSSRYIDVLMRYDSGDEIKVVMERSEYQAQLIKEAIMEGIKYTKEDILLSKLEELEQLAYERGNDAGYEAGCDR